MVFRVITLINTINKSTNLTILVPLGSLGGAVIGNLSVIFVDL